MSTPLIPLIKRGSFITFKSSGEDVRSISSSNDANGFRFSKFALLNIPPIVATNDNTSLRNVVNTRNIEGFYTSDLNQKTLLIHERSRKNLSESFQNYMLNMESLILSSPDYHRDNLRNTSERIFFKWLKEVGAIRFAEQTDVSQFKKDSEKRFVEEESDNYDKVVQYVGEIEISIRENVVDGDSYTEAYINVPSQHGSTPQILFRSISDENYNENTVVSGQSSEYIHGQYETGNTHFGLSREAMYDSDTQPDTLKYSNGWMPEKSTQYPNSYYTDKVFGVADTVEITRSKADGSDGMRYKRSSLDGISIDFDISSYKPVETYNKNNSDRISSFNDFNSKTGSHSFDFNCVLVYYDVEDSSGNVYTNLYGVLFLGDIVPYNTESAVISTTRKIRHDDITYQQGNSFSYKLNFKTDFHYGDTVSHHVINDASTKNILLFSDVLLRMDEISRKYDEIISINKMLMEKNKRLESFIQNNFIND